MCNYENDSEVTLIELAKRGDTKAFSELYKRIHVELYKFAIYTMKHPQDAEDAVSEAVIMAYEKIHKLRKLEAFRSWIFTILANVCRRKWRNSNEKQLNQESALTYFTEASENPDYEAALDVRQAFDILSEEEKVIVGLSVFGGYNSSEIGGMLKLNANTVRSKRSRALEKMAYVLK